MSDGDFNDKGVAQAKDKLNGKALPFLTTGGEGVSKRKSGKETKKLLIYYSECFAKKRVNPKDPCTFQEPTAL